MVCEEGEPGNGMGVVVAEEEAQQLLPAKHRPVSGSDVTNKRVPTHAADKHAWRYLAKRGSAKPRARLRGSSLVNEVNRNTHSDSQRAIQANGELQRRRMRLDAEAVGRKVRLVQRDHCVAAELQSRQARLDARESSVLVVDELAG